MNEELLKEIMDAIANLRDEYVDIEMVSEYHGHDIIAEIISCPISALLYTGDYIELLQKRVQELEEIKSEAIKQIDVTQRRNKRLEERVQELEEENNRIRQMKYHEAYEQGKFDTNMKVWYELPKLEQQNKHYREAMEFYADTNNYKLKGKATISSLVFDGGMRAREALEGEE